MPESPASPASPAVSSVPPTSTQESSLPSPLSFWKKGFRHYADFRGCASRAESGGSWLFPPGVDSSPGGYILTDWLHIPDTRLSIYGDALTILLWAVLFIPSISAAFRRLHDTGRSGLWLFSLFIPFGLGHLIFLSDAGRKQGGRQQIQPPSGAPTG